MQGKPYAGNPHVRFDEGADVSVRPVRSALLYKVHYAKLWFSLAVLPLPGFTAFADWSWSGKTGSVTIPPDTTAV